MSRRRIGVIFALVICLTAHGSNQNLTFATQTDEVTEIVLEVETVTETVSEIEESTENVIIEEPTKVEPTTPEKTAEEIALEEANKAIGEIIIMQKGDKSEDVKELQLLLTKTGDFTYPSATGYYGQITVDAVLSYQNRNALEANGKVSYALINYLRETQLENIEVSRGGTERSKYGVLKDWFKEVRGILVNRGDVLEIQDFETGRTFKVMVTYGTNHADVEPINLEETNKILDIYGKFSWDRHAVLVQLNGETVAASLALKPHAGLDSQPEGKRVSGRSADYGRGYNFDKVKGNGVDGVIDLHFLNSKKHNTGAKCPKHQGAVMQAAGLE